MNSEPIEYHRACFLLTRYFLRIGTRVFGITLIVLMAIAAFVFPAAGRLGTPEWLLFIGRFHPLVLHLPIGLIVLVPALHLLT